MHSLLLNEHPFNARENDLPCLITYGEKTGGSHFSIVLVANLFQQGSKLLFFTAYPMARDDFMEQIKGNEDQVLYITDINQLDPTFQCIIIQSGNEELFLEVLEKLPDVKERVILVKNIEAFSDRIFENLVHEDKIILSGNIDLSTSKESLTKRKYSSLVVFSKPEIDLGIDTPNLEKYAGYLKNERESGIVSVQMI